MRATTTATTSTVTRAEEARKKNYLRQWKFISFAERLTSWPKARSFRRDPRFTPDFSPIFNHVPTSPSEKLAALVIIIIVVVLPADWAGVSISI